MIYIIYIIILLLLCACLYIYCKKSRDDDEVETCGVQDDAMERSVFLRDPPFKSGETVHICIEDIDPDSGFKQRSIDVILEYIQPYVNLNFVIVLLPVPSDSGALITITNDDSAIKSKGANGMAINVGTKQPTIFIRNDNKRRILIHEFGHALGLVHETSHPGSKGRLDLEAIVEVWMSRNPGVDRATATKRVLHQNFREIDENTTGYSPIFDEDSVMLYSYGASMTLDNVALVGGNQFSAGDIAQLKFMYP